MADDEKEVEVFGQKINQNKDENKMDQDKWEPIHAITTWNMQGRNETKGLGRWEFANGKIRNEDFDIGCFQESGTDKQKKSERKWTTTDHDSDEDDDDKDDNDKNDKDENDDTQMKDKKITLEEFLSKWYVWNTQNKKPLSQNPMKCGKSYYAEFKARSGTKWRVHLHTPPKAKNLRCSQMCIVKEEYCKDPMIVSHSSKEWSKKMRPLVGWELDGCSFDDKVLDAVFSIHAPSTGDNFAAKVAINMMQNICNVYKDVSKWLVFGDFNCNPGVLRQKLAEKGLSWTILDSGQPTRPETENEYDYGVANWEIESAEFHMGISKLTEMESDHSRMICADDKSKAFSIKKNGKFNYILKPKQKQ